jgi:uncharacterized Zn finger protein
MMTHKPVNLKQLQTRARKLTVRRVARDTFVVASRSRPTLQHVVTIEYQRDGAIHARCTCPWAEHGGIGCQHVMAVLHTLAGRKRKRLSFWATLTEAQRQRQRVLRLAGDGEELYITSRTDKPKPRKQVA